MPRIKRPITDEERRLIWELHDAGLSVRAIGRQSPGLEGGGEGNRTLSRPSGAMLWSMASPGAPQVDERMGQSIRMRPWVWFSGTVVVFIVLWSTGTSTFDDNEHQSWADWATLIFVAYVVISLVVLIPRFVIPRAQQQASADRLAVIRWAFAISPFLGGFGLFAAGAHAWAMAIAAVVSTLALASTALTLQRD